MGADQAPWLRGIDVHIMNNLLKLSDLWAFSTCLNLVRECDRWRACQIRVKQLWSKNSITSDRGLDLRPSSAASTDPTLRV
jgi:hypothetical protein